MVLGSTGGVKAVTFNLDQGGTPTQNLVFNQFNPALGTPSQILVGLISSSVGGGSSFTITNATGGSAGFTGYVADLQIVGPPNVPVTEILLAGRYQATSQCAVTGFPTGSRADGSNAPVAVGSPFLTNPASPGTNVPYIGTGQVTLIAEIANFQALNEICSLVPLATGAQGACGQRSTLLWSGKVKVGYAYRSSLDGAFLFIDSADIPVALAAIPEPAGVAAMGFGLVGLIWLRKRKRA